MSSQNAKSPVNIARQLDFERKRARGEISCAECRRLKLKCDKKIPCSSCKRRGCPTICPNGTLAPGHGSRFVLADTNALHSKLNEMSERIRQLEDALQLAHSAQSSQPHPLLSENLLSVKNGVVQQTPPETNDDEQGPELDILETFGTLRIGDDGGTRFLGPSAASEGLLLLESQGREEDESVQPLELFLNAENAWPFVHVFSNKDDVMALVLAQLPSWERASALCEAFLQNVSRHSGMVSRSELIEELLPWIYRRNPDSLKKAASPHDVALVLVVFALGAAVDLTQPPNNNECQLYKQLAKVALGLQSVFNFVSLSTVQAVALLANVDLASSRKYTLEEAWKVFSFAMLLAKSIGIHRDPSRWNLGKEAIDMRRRIFWEMFKMDTWQSLSSGRSPVFTSNITDVEYPSDKDAIRASDGHLIPSFARARFRLVKEILAPVSERLSSCATPMKYIDILNLDRKIREFDDLRIEERYEVAELTGPEEVEKLQVQSWRNIVLIYLHRNFFAKALMDNPTDPLKHTFAPSFITAYRSASIVLKLYNEAFKKLGAFTARFWPAFGHLLAAGVIVGAIPAHCSLPLAHHAYKDLDLAIEAFQFVPQHPVSKHGLSILYRLKERGRRSLFGGENRLSPPARPEAPIVVPLDEALLQYQETQILRGSPLVLASQQRPDAREEHGLQAAAGAQRTETVVGLGHSSPNPDQLARGQNSLDAQELQFTSDASSSSTEPPQGANGLGGSPPQQQTPASITIHPDVFRWVAGLESYSSFDQSTWLQTTNEAATSTIVTDSDLAASLAMLQSFSGMPQTGAQPTSESQADTSFLDYDVDMSLFGPQYYTDTGGQGSGNNLFDTSTLR